MIFSVLSLVCGLIAAVIIAIKLTCWPSRFNAPERVGMGLIAAGMVLTIGPVLGNIYSMDTPFDDWGAAVLRFGCCVYFVGRMSRHRLANWTARRDARRHLAGGAESLTGRR